MKTITAPVPKHTYNVPMQAKAGRSAHQWLVCTAFVSALGACTSESAKEPSAAVTVQQPQLQLPQPPSSAAHAVLIAPAASAAQGRPEPALADLAVRFTGSVLTGEGSQFRAVLSVGAGPARRVKVGEEIAEGIIVTEIQQDSITLQSARERRRVPIEHRIVVTRAEVALPNPASAMTAAPANIDEAFRQALKNQLSGQK